MSEQRKSNKLFWIKMNEFHSLKEYSITDILSWPCVTFAEGVLKLKLSLMSSPERCLVTSRLNNSIMHTLVMTCCIFMTTTNLGWLSLNHEPRKYYWILATTWKIPLLAVKIPRDVKHSSLLRTRENLLRSGYNLFKLL